MRQQLELVELRRANTPKEENYEMIDANLIEAIDLTLRRRKQPKRVESGDERIFG